jgi:catalase
MSATPPTVVAQLVETMRALAGSHPGFRPVHAKGIVCSGTFRGAPQARGVTRALHLQGQTVPTLIRFSNSSGNPEVHDGVANARALAVKFQLPDGKNADVWRSQSKGFPRGRLKSFSRSCGRSSRTPLPVSPRPTRSPGF